MRSADRKKRSDEADGNYTCETLLFGVKVVRRSSRDTFQKHRRKKCGKWNWWKGANEDVMAAFASVTLIVSLFVVWKLWGGKSSGVFVWVFLRFREKLQFEFTETNWWRGNRETETELIKDQSLFVDSHFKTIIVC